MPHLHTEPGQYDQTVSAFIVRLDTPEPTIMAHKHKLLKRYLQFGGHIELNEDPWTALTHEILEESGYDISQLKVLQPHTRLKTLPGSKIHPTPIMYLTHDFGDLDHKHTDSAFVFTTKETPAHPIAEGESDDIKLFTEEELKALGNDKMQNSTRDICLFVLGNCLPNLESVNTQDYQN